MVSGLNLLRMSFELCSKMGLFQILHSRGEFWVMLVGRRWQLPLVHLLRGQQTFFSSLRKMMRIWMMVAIVHHMMMIVAFQSPQWQLRPKAFQGLTLKYLQKIQGMQCTATPEPECIWKELWCKGICMYTKVQQNAKVLKSGKWTALRKMKWREDHLKQFHYHPHHCKWDCQEHILIIIIIIIMIFMCKWAQMAAAHSPRANTSLPEVNRAHCTHITGFTLYTLHNLIFST